MSLCLHLYICKTQYRFFGLWDCGRFYILQQDKMNSGREKRESSKPSKARQSFLDAQEVKREDHRAAEKNKVAERQHKRGPSGHKPSSRVVQEEAARKRGFDEQQ
jgi:hypothetical protein